MGKVDLEKLRSINFGGKVRGKSRVRRIISTDDGATTTGFEIDYYDGRQEAVVRPGPVEETFSIGQGKLVRDG